MKYLILVSFFVVLASASEIPAGAELCVAFDRPEYFIGENVPVRVMASVATPEATSAMVELATKSKGTFVLQVAEKLVWRMPFRQNWGWLSRGGKPRARVIALAWDDRLTPAVRRLAEKWLTSDDPLFIAAAGELLTSVGTVADAPAVFRVMDCQIVSLTRPRELIATTSELPKPLPQLLEFISVLSAQGYALDENALHGEGQVLAYFRMFRPETPRSPIWRRLLETYAHSSHFALREAAIHSIPYPVPPDCVALVDAGKSDPDAGVRSAALFVSEHKIHDFNASPSGPPRLISIPLPPDSK